ncbi:hypothetical protein ATANTOWER_005288 [Ataeniobius toweri]|uniref:Uncharacterized protein n=1 Tax=Ataeniobius toweri TaxID=208326 RepID=A0ABU7C002_9TELE|nr:hypothetical protein [Ataeniobius toweri]
MRQGTPWTDTLHDVEIRALWGTYHHFQLSNSCERMIWYPPNKATGCSPRTQRVAPCCTSALPAALL